MGYTTDFNGEFGLNKPLSAEHKTFLEKFSGTRRMNRKEAVAAKLQDSVRIAAGLPVGKDGAYFVGGKEDFGQGHDESIANYNTPPSGQPSLWCQWVPNDDGTAIVWDGGEKFYEYVDWIEYLINNFLQPWGYVLNGEVEWFGEDRDDRGLIVVDNNAVSTKTAVVSYE